MTDDSVGWDKAQAEAHDLNSVPRDWSGYTRAAKVEKLVEVVQHYLVKVRLGTFNPKYGESLAALALEAQMELADFYADAEASAKSAKYLVEFTEAETAVNFAKKATEDDIKVTETSLKRMASISSEVKQAKQKLVNLEKDHRKWRYVYDTLKEAHIFFRNIGKL